MQTEDIKLLIPPYYTEAEKKEIMNLLIDLANIYFDNEE
jgi:hypothetical protein